MRQLNVITLLLFILLLTTCGGAETPTPPPTATLPAEIALGKKVFVTHCGACHSLSPDLTIVGPSLDGIATSGNTRVDGQDARTYIYTAILNPGAYLADGYEDLMPATFGKQLSGEELDAVVTYLLWEND